ADSRTTGPIWRAMPNFLRSFFVLLLQPFTRANIQNRDAKKDDRSEKKDDIEHGELPPLRSAQNLTRIDKSMRFSIFFKSGVKPGTKEPGVPQMLLTNDAVGQLVGVMPPGPEKYGTFAAR